jgi:hypothetical protein
MRGDESYELRYRNETTIVIPQLFGRSCEYKREAAIFIRGFLRGEKDSPIELRWSAESTPIESEMTSKCPGSGF